MLDKCYGITAILEDVLNEVRGKYEKSNTKLLQFNILLLYF